MALLVLPLACAVETLEVVRVVCRRRRRRIPENIFFEKKRTVGMKAPIPSMTNDQRDYSYLLTYC